MYTVLIADDEPNTRRGLCLFVDWAALDCTIVAQAEDGIAARDYLSEHPVDIVITDIRMPGMDGLQLSQYVFEYYPETCVILLTAHADFSYAQSAIRYKVVDFVIKIDPAVKITEAVIKAKECLLHRRSLSGEIQRLQRHLTTLQSELYETFLRDVLHHTLVQPEQLEKKAAELGMLPSHFFLILCRFYPPRETAGSSLPLPALRRFFMQTLCANHCISAYMDDYTLGMLLLADNESEALPSRQTLESICTDGLELTNRFTRVLLRIGISTAHKRVAHMPLAQQQAEGALTAAFGGLGSNMCFFSDIASVPYHPVSPTLFYPALESAIRKNDEVGARAVILQLMTAFKNSGETAEQIKASCGRLPAFLTTFAADTTTPASDMIGEGDAVQQIKFSCSMADLESIVTKLVQQTIFMLHANNGRDTFVVRKIREYIQCHYHHKDITLQSIADHVYLNSSYMSRMYKKTTGESLIHSIHKLRMEKAKHLLHDPSYRISQIASAIGIDDSSYFTSLFTKYEGISPTEYRNKA